MFIIQINFNDFRWRPVIGWFAFSQPVLPTTLFCEFAGFFPKPSPLREHEPRLKESHRARLSDPCFFPVVRKIVFFSRESIVPSIDLTKKSSPGGRVRLEFATMSQGSHVMFAYLVDSLYKNDSLLFLIIRRANPRQNNQTLPDSAPSVSQSV